MEGSYNKILAARSSVPYAQYSFFIDILVETVRLVMSYHAHVMC